jgi:peroxiredoxin
VASPILVLALAVGAGDYWVDRRAYERAVARHEELARRTGLPVGLRAPQFELPGACGPRLSLDSLRARGKPVLVVFADLSCCACQPLLEQIGRWQKTLTRELTVAVISNENAARSRELCDRYGIADVLLQQDYAVLDAYAMPATPSAVILDINGVVASASASGYRMIHTLLHVALRRGVTRTERWQVSTQPT